MCETLDALQSLLEADSLSAWAADLISSGNATGQFASIVVRNVAGGINALIDGLNRAGAAMERFINTALAFFGVGGINLPDIPRLVLNMSALAQSKSGLAKGKGIPGLAEGGNVIRGGWTVVGELGPELLNLNAGSQVRPLDNPPGGLPAVYVQNPFTGEYLLAQMARTADGRVEAKFAVVRSEILAGGTA